jgi:hypothetical protein
MRTETKQIRIYKFEELSEDAKRVASYELMGDYIHSEEAIEVLKKCLNTIGVNLVDYEIDWSNSMPTRCPTLEVRSSLDCSEVESIAKAMLDLKHTGICFECDFGDEILNSLACGVKGLKELAMAGVSGLIKAAQKDYECLMHEEQVQEHCNVNEYEFLSDGTLY